MSDVYDKLNQAQDLLSDVYFWLRENDLDHRGMSKADTCIIETKNIVRDYERRDDDTRSQSKEEGCQCS